MKLLSFKKFDFRNTYDIINQDKVSTPSILIFCGIVQIYKIELLNFNCEFRYQIFKIFENYVNSVITKLITLKYTKHMKICDNFFNLNFKIRKMSHELGRKTHYFSK